VYISRDIVFDEAVFPFAALHSNAGARLREEINLLPLNLQPLNLHSHAGHVLPADHTDNAAPAESFLRDTGENLESDGDSSNFFSSWR
jgi:hypothetical protein